jgi:hypothetical protein
MKRNVIALAVGCAMLTVPCGGQNALSAKTNATAVAGNAAGAQSIEELTRSLSGKLAEATTSKKWDEALSILNEMKKSLPSEMATELDFMRFGILLNKEDTQGALVQARNIVSIVDDPAILDDLAWELATAPEFKKKDLKLAEESARKANKLSGGEDPEIVETLARITFMKGDRKEAVSLQKLAIAKCRDNPELKKELEADLKDYKAGKLPSDE